MRKLFIAALTAIVFVVSASAWAVVKTINFSGTIVTTFGAIPTGLSASFTVDDAFSGSYTYDTTLSGTVVPGTNSKVKTYDGATDLRVTQR